MAKDQEKFKKLWIRYVEERATPQEIDELFAALQDESLHASHAQWAEQAMIHAGSDLPADKAREDAIWQQLLRQADGLAPSLADTPSDNRKRLRRLVRWAWAASIAVVLGVAAYFAVHKAGPTPTQATTPANIVPGKHGAILSLADGTQIMLDSLADGTISQYEGARVTFENHSLTYQTDAPATEAVYHTMTTPRGRQFNLTLPDGSRVWLNAASSIRYPTAFTGTERHVEITGEAYFEVVGNPDKPFRVSLDDTTSITVLGTRFNVHAYGPGADSRTTLLEGAIRIRKGGQRLTLQPGQQAHLLNEIHLVDDVDVSSAVAWKNGFFNFEGLPLREVMQQLARWYDIDVTYEGHVPNVVFHGKVYRDMPFEDVCYILKRMGVKFNLIDRTFTITE